MIESFAAMSSRLDALIFKETFEEKLQKLFEKDSSLEEYVNLVKEMYDMPGFRDLKPIPAYDMSGLREKDEEQWNNIRKHGAYGDIPYVVGGSKVASILGLSSFSSPLLEKAIFQKANIKKPQAKNDAILKRGHYAEDFVAKQINDVSGFENVEVLDDQTMYEHPVFEFMNGNIDRFLRFEDGRKGIAEIKTLSTFNADAKEDWQNGIVPIQYQLQGVWYMSIMNLNTVDFFCAWGLEHSDLAHVHMERNIDIEIQAIGAVLHFLEVVVKKDGEPDLTRASGKVVLQDLYQLSGDNFEKGVYTEIQDAGLMNMVLNLNMYKEQLKDFEKEVKSQKETIVQEIEKLNSEIALYIQDVLVEEAKTLAEEEGTTLGDDYNLRSGGIILSDGSCTTTVYYKSKKQSRFSQKRAKEEAEKLGLLDEFEKIYQLGLAESTSKSVSSSKIKMLGDLLI